MKNKLVIALIAVTAIFMAACSTQRTTFSDVPSDKEPDSSSMQLFFLQGIAQTQGVQAVETCGSAANVAQVETKQSFVDVLLSVVTFNIFTPRHAYIYCRR